MPRVLAADSTFDTLEEEVLYTAAALGADEDSLDLLPMTVSWMGRIDAARLADRSVRSEVVSVDAVRQVANRRLDDSCESFGDELYLSCGKDRDNSRWKQFFPEAVSRFIRRALSAQVLSVQGWLTSTDAVFLRHKPAIERWVGKADAILVRGKALAMRRGENWMRRTDLCASLTQERDLLHAALVQRAAERGLSRDWPDAFFRIISRSSKEDDKGEESETSQSEATATPG